MNILSASSPFLSQVIVLLFFKKSGYNNNRLPQVRNTRNRSNPGYRKYRPAFYNNQNGDKFADPMNTGFYRLFPKSIFTRGTGANYPKDNNRYYHYPEAGEYIDYR